MTINEFRKSKKLTVEQMAKELGYSISAVAKILYGERGISGRFLKKLKNTYPDVNVDKFFCEQKPRNVCETEAVQ